MKQKTTFLLFLSPTKNQVPGGMFRQRCLYGMRRTHTKVRQQIRRDGSSKCEGVCNVSKAESAASSAAWKPKRMHEFLTKELKVCQFSILSRPGRNKRQHKGEKPNLMPFWSGLLILHQHIQPVQVQSVFSDVSTFVP